jgi:ribosomal protein S18 acetylase RimI-like enzyme
MPQHRANLRRVNAGDEIVIKKWFEDPQGCKMAIGHHPFTNDDFHQWMEAEDQLGWILEDTNGPMAYGEIWVDYDGKDLELAHVIVNPEYRGQGFGRLLTDLLYEQARHFGFSSVYMRVYPDNKAALECYRSAKFTRIDDLSPEMSPEWVWLCRSYKTSS